MQVLAKSEDIARLARTWRQDGDRLGLVPTMGALHEGHLSLARASLKENERTIATIFVNPAQFGPNEDLAKYPRTIDRDLALLETLGVDAVFTPDEAGMYREGHASWITVEGLTSVMCGQSRPTHFRGVTTVVGKFFNLLQPDNAYFGQKDYQQATVIRRMVRDLDWQVRIHVCPIVREADGLALSSRNRFLSPEERARATVLHRALGLAAETAHKSRDPRETLGVLEATIAAEPLARIDYAVVVHPDTLQPVTDFSAGAVFALAVFFGPTRLIDNLVLPAI